MRVELERLPLLAQHRPLAYAIAILFSLAAWWLRSALDPVFPPGFPYLTFFPAVIVASFLFGRGPGTLAALLCGLVAWYFFIPPFHSFSLGHGTGVALGFYVGVVSVDIAVIHWMQRANGRLAAERERTRRLAEERSRLAERAELLFHELQHRVSNNLQMVGAVLNLQRRDVADPAARQALSDASTKVQMIGRIQRQLYGTEGEQVALDLFLPELVADLVAAGGKPGVRYAVDAQAGIRLPPDAAIPVALILAESVANAVEHGFADRETGEIRVAASRRGDAVELVVADDGAGLPDGFDLEATTSLGMRIARTLAQQLGARLTVTPAAPGTETRLLCPVAAA